MALLGGRWLRRGPVLVLLLVVGVVGAVLIAATQLRPSLAVYAPVRIPQAAAGTTYAVDEQLCLEGAQVGATVREVSTPDTARLTVDLRRQPDGPPVIAFPVDPEAARSAVGARVPVRDELCLRLLVRPEQQGTAAAPEVSVGVRYGPGGVFRRTFRVRPPTTVEADRTGRDPRLDAG
ncbi:MAG: hypothetical protein JWO60_1416 [Frankiales bacterium]|nr:hypothetical protein [Frankiales bacterium]